MPEFKLEMLDANQAAEVRRVVQQQIPQARIVEGVQDLAGGSYSQDNHITIDYDEQIIDDVLRQHFEPQNKNWRDYVVS